MLQGGSLPNLKKKGGGAMNTYEILSLLFFGGNFLVALLTYIDRKVPFANLLIFQGSQDLYTFIYTIYYTILSNYIQHSFHALKLL